MPAVAERPGCEGHIGIVTRYEHSVASENVNELLACRGCLAVLCVLPLRVITAEKRGLSKNFEGIPDIQMWQTIPQSCVGQTQEFHVIMSARGVQLLQGLVGVWLCSLHRSIFVQSFTFCEPLLYVLLLVERIVRVLRGLDLVRKREGKWGDVGKVGLGSGDAPATLYGWIVGQGIFESRD